MVFDNTCDNAETTGIGRRNRMHDRRGAVRNGGVILRGCCARPATEGRWGHDRRLETGGRRTVRRRNAGAVGVAVGAAGKPCGSLVLAASDRRSPWDTA